MLEMSTKMQRKSDFDAPGVASDLHRIQVLRSLPPHQLERVWAALEPRSLRARATLVMEADPLQHAVFFVWSGLCRIVQVSPQGNVVSLITFEPGAIGGYLPPLLDGGRQSNVVGTRLIADHDCLLLTMPREIYLSLMKEVPDFRDAITRVLAMRIAELTSRIYELGALDVRGRLVAELLRLASRGTHVDGRLILDPAPTHLALATQVGATREAITRHLRDLVEEGIIDMRRGVIEFAKPQALRKLDAAVAGPRHGQFWGEPES